MVINKFSSGDDESNKCKNILFLFCLITTFDVYWQRYIFYFNHFCKIIHVLIKSKNENVKKGNETSSLLDMTYLFIVRNEKEL